YGASHHRQGVEENRIPADRAARHPAPRRAALACRAAPRRPGRRRRCRPYRAWRRRRTLRAPAAQGGGPAMTPLGAKLRKMREERGMTLKQMAQALDVSSAYLSAL